MTEQRPNEELSMEELERALAVTPDPTLPDEIDGIPFDHVGDIDAPADAPQDNPATPPFDVEKELEGVQLF
jgi:hypothetical protein